MESIPVSFSFVQKINLRSFLGFIISGVLLWLTFYKSGLHLQDIRLQGTQWYYFSGAIVSFIIATWFQAVRAKLLWIDEAKRGRLVDTYGSLLIGNFYNCLLPGNLGDGVRAWHFSRKQQIPFSSSLAAVISEKWIDAQMFVGLTIVLFSLKPFSNNYIFWAICNTSLVVLLLSATYMLMLKYAFFEKLIWGLIIRLRKPGRFLFRIYKYAGWQMMGVKRNGAISSYVLLCMVVLFLNVLQFFFLLKASGVNGPVLSLYSAYLIAVSMMIIAIVPSAPGNIGVIHYGLYSVLILAAGKYGVNPGETELHSYAIFGIYVHLSYLIPEVILGAVYVIKDRKLLLEPQTVVK